MSRRKLLIIALFVLVVPATGWVVADALGILRTPDGSVQRGITMEQVKAQKGDPKEIIGPVGDPPIIKWVYGDAEVVVFEFDRVIDSFYKRR